MAQQQRPAIFLLILLVGVLLYFVLVRGKGQPSGYPGAAYGGRQDDAAINAASHVVNLAAIAPQVSSSGGTERIASADNAYILNVPSNQILANWAISIADMRLNQGGVREPHWHPNAVELSYVSRGSANVTIFLGSPTVVQEAFTVQEGDLFFVPRAFMHHVENTSSGETRVLSAWNNERIQSVNISESVASIPPRVNDQTFHMAGSNFFAGLGQSGGIGDKNTASGTTQSTRALNPPGSAPTPKPASKYKFSFSSAQPSVNTPGGSDTEGNIGRFPVLEGLACFNIILNPGGIREPHWHPNCAELHYVLEGRGTFLNETPGTRAVETATIDAGSFFYVPPAYLHYFENADSNNKLHVAAFFTSADPQDIGFSGGISSYSNSVLSATFNKPASYFNTLKRFTLDDGIVGGSKS